MNTKTPREISIDSAREGVAALAERDPKLAAALTVLLDSPGCGDDCCEDWERGITVGIGLAAKALAVALTPAPPKNPPPCYAATGKCDGSCDGLGDPFGGKR